MALDRGDCCVGSRDPYDIYTRERLSPFVSWRRCGRSPPADHRLISASYRAVMHAACERLIPAACYQRES